MKALPTDIRILDLEVGFTYKTFRATLKFGGSVKGPSGRAWCERVWTAVATCRQQSRSVFEFLHSALHAHFSGQPAPSLLPA